MTNCQMNLHTNVHECKHINTLILKMVQTHSCLSELHAGQYPTVIKTRLLWRHRHHTNTHNLTHTHRHMCTHTYCFKANCLFPLCSLSVSSHATQTYQTTHCYIYTKKKTIGRHGRQTDRQTDSDRDRERHKQRQTYSYGSRHEWVIQNNIKQVKNCITTGGNSAV